MKSQALQEMISKIFGDEKTRSEFLSNPKAVIARYSLTEPEERAVLATHARMGIISSDSPALEAALNPTATWFAPS